MLQDETDAEQINELLEKNKPDPMDVAVFLLSGGTTGLPKVIPRTHNDYLYTAKATALPSGLSKYSVYLAIAPLAHNMTLACPGISGHLPEWGKSGSR
ncbi:MAG: AMP-binding protein [Dethiobacteria bacterium]